MNKFLKEIISVSVAVLVATTSLLMPVAADTTSSTGANVVFTGGELSLQTVPGIDYGSHVIVSSDQVYAGTVSGEIAVSDSRGTAVGWKLGVKLSTFSNDGGATITLRGAKIGITPSNAYTTTGSGVLPGTVSPVEMISGDTTVKSMTSAAIGQGAGLMKNTIVSSELTVYGSTALVGGHEAKLDWILSDAP